MSFMAGLSLGAVLVDKGAGKRHVRERISRTWGSALLVGFGFLGALLALRVTYHSTASLVETALFLLAAGFLVSGMFAYTTLRNVDDQYAVITPLYSADLIGGCLGSLAGSLLLVPIAGLTTTSLSMIPLAFICALLL